MELETAPNSATVESYILTRAAEQAWRQINSNRSSGDSPIHWIYGPPGSGKTHFLNYLLALERRAGSGEVEHGRQITCDLRLEGGARADIIERLCLDALARELVGDPRPAIIWREMRGTAAISVALEHARRTGVRSITIACDFGPDDCAETLPFLAALAAGASEVQELRVRIFAAVRDRPPDSAVAFEVGPADSDEATVIAVRRARRLADDASGEIEEAYGGIETGSLDPCSIYPFHPVAVRALASVASPPATVAAISWLAREVLRECEIRDGSVSSANQLVCSADLMRIRVVAAAVESQLGESGRAALRIARAALAAFNRSDHRIAADIIDTLVVERAHVGASRLALDELAARLGASAVRAKDGIELLRGLIAKLVESTQGVINADGAGIRFEPGAASAPEIAEFNAALALARRFAPDLARVQSAAELEAAVARLGDAMADAVEKAAGDADVLKPEMAAAGTHLAAEQQKAIADYIALAEAGPALLLKTATDSAKAAEAARTLDDYEAVSLVAAAIPKLRSMRRYLEGTRLGERAEVGFARDPDIASLQADYQLLNAELGPRALAGTRSSIDAIEARFDRFCSRYAQHYRIAHAQRQQEMGRVAAVLDEVRRYCEALRRLNAIAALGPPDGESLQSELAALAAGAVRCDQKGDPRPERNPLCVRCGYVLGAESPGRGLEDLFERIRRSLQAKLAALSQSAIARLIHEHDRARRLEGFLKITQAAQTDALVRVLDEKLARYLAQMLDENLAAQDTERTSVLEIIEVPQLKSVARKHASAPRVVDAKPPRQRGDN
jgi:hypothetical protein